MTVLASGSKGNSAVIAAGATRLLVDAGLSCREILKRMAAAGEDPEQLDAILITHEHLDHVAGLSVLARRLRVPVFFTEPTHRAWVRMVRPRRTLTYAQWLEKVRRDKEERAAQWEKSAARLPAHLLAGESARDTDLDIEHFTMAALPAELDEEAEEASSQNTSAEAEVEPCEPEDTKAAAKVDPAFLPEVEYFRAGHRFTVGEIDIDPFTIPHDAADPCGFVFHARTEAIRMAVATDLGYIPPNVKQAFKDVDVLLLESNHDLEMLKDGPYPWSVKQRVLSRVGHLSNDAAAEFLLRDYDGGAHTIVLGHISEQNNLPELALLAAEQAIGSRMTLLGNRILLARQEEPLAPICL